MIGQAKRRIRNKRGFTLIEVIAVLVLVGIIAAVAGLGIVKVAEGYLFARLNAEAAQKTQIAIARITKELATATAVTAAGASSVTFTRPESPGSSTTYTNVIDFSGGAVRVNVNGAGARTLIDNATAFALEYRDASGTVTGVTANIRRIDFDLTVTAADNTAINFNNNSVYLREF
jgi:prepilin-type N-terminal cleavage/methylation domain-containing protein